LAADGLSGEYIAFLPEGPIFPFLIADKSAISMDGMGASSDFNNPRQ
jgi:hypothetical protein